MTCFDYLRDAQAPEIDCENEYVRCVRTDVARAHDAALDVTRDEPARHLTWYRYAIRPEKNTLWFPLVAVWRGRRPNPRPRHRPIEVAGRRTNSREPYAPSIRSADPRTRAVGPSRHAR